MEIEEKSLGIRAYLDLDAIALMKGKKNAEKNSFSINRLKLR